MLGWLWRPRCPVDEATRAWVDAVFAWLVECFGAEEQQRELVCPTPACFPERFDGSLAVLRNVLQRIAERIGVPADEIELRLYSEESSQGKLLRQAGLGGSWREKSSAGHFIDSGAADGRRFVIGLEQSNARDAMSVVATFAHEVCHALLLGQGYLHPESPAMEETTDLATVFFGYGIFTANALVRERNWDSAGWQGWSVGRQGYLTFENLGYALALHAKARGERRPPWAAHLRPDARVPFRRALRFVWARG